MICYVLMRTEKHQLTNPQLRLGFSSPVNLCKRRAINGYDQNGQLSHVITMVDTDSWLTMADKSHGETRWFTPMAENG